MYLEKYINISLLYSIIVMLNSNLVITGEKIQEKCDIYLGKLDDFNFNPRIAGQTNKFCYFDNIQSEFDNPKLIFSYTHNIYSLANKISFFKNDFILITHNSDENIIECESVITILNCDKLSKWYTQNMCYEHEKLFFLFIGLANSQWSHGNLSIFDNPSIMNNLHIKSKNIYFNFGISTNSSKRQPCYDLLKDKLEWLQNIQPIDNLYRLKEYEFCICPEGNGLDTHRLWEALYLKVVPIVIDSAFSRILQKNKLPIIILESWDKLDPSSLNYKDHNFDIIYDKFTMDTILNF